MFKLIVLSALMAVAAAKPGLLASPLVGAAYAPAAYAAAPLAYAPAPIAYSAPLVKAAVPVATSFANTYKVSLRSPLIAAAPLSYAASPVVAAPALHAPLAYSPYASTIIH